MEKYSWMQDMFIVKIEFSSRLNNRFLYSGGFGIDILTLYDFKLALNVVLTS